MEVCFLLLSCAPNHTHPHMPIPNFPKGILPLSLPLSCPNPCKVMRALIYRAHLCPSHLGSEMWVQEGGQETTNHLRKAQDFYSKEKVFAIAPKRTSSLFKKKIRKKIIKRPCLGNGEVIYSQHHCVLYRKKSTGELTAETHLLSACPAQNCSEHLESLDFIYTNVYVGRGVCMCLSVCVCACPCKGPLQSKIYTVIYLQKEKVMC